MRNKYVYAIRKLIPIKVGPDMDAETVYSVPFSEPMKLEPPQDDPVWIHVTYKHKTGNYPAIAYTGYVKRSWVALNEVHDIAKLRYQNQTEKTFVTLKTYGGRPIGTIEPGETVFVRAYCSPYALTNKGWVRADLIAHEENATEQCLIRVPVDDFEGIVLLLKALLDKAHNDYVEDWMMRDGIRRWARSKRFSLFYGEYDDVFLERCEKCAGDHDEKKHLRKIEIMRNAKKVEPSGRRKAGEMDE